MMLHQDKAAGGLRSNARDLACGALCRGGTKVVEVVCAGGTGGQSIGCQGCEPGWGAASSAGEPVLLLP